MKQLLIENGTVRIPDRKGEMKKIWYAEENGILLLIGADGASNDTQPPCDPQIIQLLYRLQKLSPKQLRWLLPVIDSMLKNIDQAVF